MRFLILYAATSGLLAAAIVSAPAGTAMPGSDGEPLDAEGLENLGVTDAEDGATAVIGLPEGDFRPDLFDEEGDEIAVTFLDMGAPDVGVGGPDNGVTSDDSVDNTAANNG